MKRNRNSRRMTEFIDNKYEFIDDKDYFIDNEDDSNSSFSRERKNKFSSHTKRNKKLLSSNSKRNLSQSNIFGKSYQPNEEKVRTISQQEFEDIKRSQNNRR